MDNRHLKLSASLLLVGGLSVFSANAATEDTVKQRLDERSVKFEIDGDGDYKVLYSFTKEKRSQLVFVSGKTETLRTLTIREIFSPSANLKTAGIDDKKALELLMSSRKNKLGSWEVSNDVLYLVIKIPDNINALDLEAAMDNAAEIADDMELKLTGKDVF